MRKPYQVHEVTLKCKESILSRERLYAGWPELL